MFWKFTSHRHLVIVLMFNRPANGPCKLFCVNIPQLRCLASNSIEIEYFSMIRVKLNFSIIITNVIFMMCEGLIEIEIMWSVGVEIAIFLLCLEVFMAMVGMEALVLKVRWGRRVNNKQRKQDHCNQKGIDFLRVSFMYGSYRIVYGISASRAVRRRVLSIRTISLY